MNDMLEMLYASENSNHSISKTGSAQDVWRNKWSFVELSRVTCLLLVSGSFF